MAQGPHRAWNPALATVLTLLAAGGAFALARQTASPAPLGVPLPIPVQKYITAGVKPQDTDVVAGKIAPVWLEHLTAEPDGSLPLIYPYDSARGGFTVRHQRGAMVLEEPAQEFARSQLDALCTFDYHQPLTQVRYIMPLRKDNEKVTEYVARSEYELGQQGGKLIEGHKERLELPRYRFEHFEYTAPDTQLGTAYHVWYVGPLGRSRVLAIDFMTTPALIDKARPQIDKIMGSFTPHLELAEVMLTEDPTYGEWAGTKYVEMAQKQQAEWDQAAAEMKLRDDKLKALNKPGVPAVKPKSAAPKPPATGSAAPPVPQSAK